jgi:flagellar motor switch protein FliM
MRAVELVHEDLAERLTTSMPTFLRTNVRPRLVHTEQGRFHDFIKDFPANSLFHLITLAPLPSQMIFTLSPNISLIVLEQRLGGKVESNVSERPLTDIDQALLRELVEHMLGDMKAGWSKLVTIEPMLEDSTTNQHWVQMMMGNERVMLLTFELIISGVSGTMSLFIPFTTLKPIAGLLNPHIWITGKKEHQIDPVVRQTVMGNLNQVILPFTAILGKSSMKIGEIVHLQVGDVILLDGGPADCLTVLVANKRQFIGKVGKSNRHYAVQIVDAIHEKGMAPVEKG